MEGRSGGTAEFHRGLDLDDLLEQAFLNVGDADSARAKARELEANA
jgi:hypothetical protein